MTDRFVKSLLLFLLLLFTAGVTVGFTYAPCYASVCSEEFFGLQTRIHIAIYYALLAGISAALGLRTCSATWARVSNSYISNRRFPVLDRQISIGGLGLALLIVGVPVLTTPLWVHAQLKFWAIRTDPVGWTDAKIRLAVTGVLGHHADFLIGLVIIPVGRHGLLAKIFSLHQGTLLFAHKLVAYLMVAAALAHGAAYFTFVGIHKTTEANSARRNAFCLENPTLTVIESQQRGRWYSATLPTGMLAFILTLAIAITALPSLRRRNYNVFYYTHMLCSIAVFITVSFHASTDFYFLLPGLFLWMVDWTWRIFKGDTGLGRKVDATVLGAGGGWYKIVLPVSVRATSKRGFSGNADDGVMERQSLDHPLQTYHLNFPSVSLLETHAFSAASIGSHASGPVILFRKARVTGLEEQKKQEAEWTWKLVGKIEVPTSLAGKQILQCRAEGPHVPSVRGFERAEEVVCLVGGTGLTGAHSLALWWFQHRRRDPTSRFTLVWTVRSRETSQLGEWLDLVDHAATVDNMTIVLHISSESGHLDINQCLRKILGAEGPEPLHVRRVAWVYASGPKGVLNASKDVCNTIRRELRSEKAGDGRSTNISDIECYAADWEL